MPEDSPAGGADVRRSSADESPQPPAAPAGETGADATGDTTAPDSDAGTAPERPDAGTATGEPAADAPEEPTADESEKPDGEPSENPDGEPAEEQDDEPAEESDGDPDPEPAEKSDGDPDAEPAGDPDGPGEAAEPVSPTEKPSSPRRRPEPSRKRKRPARKRRRARSPWWAKTMVFFGVLLMLGAGGAAVGAKILTDRVNDAVQQEDLLGSTAVKTGVDYVSTEGPLNFLMIGTDSRDPNDVDAEARTDTIMILHIPAGLRRAYLVSIPRDLWVHIPRCWDGETGCEQRVNAAYVFGGDTRAQRFTLLAETVSGFTGLKFDGAAIINFNSFKEVVDLVGGVDLCLEETITSIHTNKTFEQGCGEYGPADALDIVRQRKMYADGDFARQRMQQRFVKSLLRRAEDQGYLSDPRKITQLIEKVGKTLTVQCPTGMQPTDVAYTLRHIHPDDMTMVKVPTYGRTIGGAQVLIAQDDAEGLWRAIVEDDLSPFLGAHPELVNRDIDEDGEPVEEDEPGPVDPHGH